MEKAMLLDPLTERELEILERLTDGLSDQQIAADLFLSPNTVRWYNRQIYSKLGVGSRTQAIARAKALGLLNNNAPAQAAPDVRHNLPAQTTSFIGRSREIAEAKHLLTSNRLLTLTGPGGSARRGWGCVSLQKLSARFQMGSTLSTSPRSRIMRWWQTRLPRR